MRFDRRAFLAGGPAALLGITELSDILAQPRTADMEAVIDFWQRGMGVPAEMLIGGEKSRGRTARQPSQAEFAREPLFLHYDEDEKALIPATEIPPARLASTGDSKVDFQLLRLRLNSEDNKTFQGYSSGAIYFDMQQAQEAPASSNTSDTLVNLASSVFSAIFPKSASSHGAGGNTGASGSKGSPGASDKGGSGKKGGGAPKGSGGGNSFDFMPQSDSGAKGGSPPATIPLQQAKQAQSLNLPNGRGRSAFACFAKGRKKTAFGQFVSAIMTVSTSPAVSYIPILSIPLVSSAALPGLRALVANLQAHGGDQQPLIQSPTMDVATTAAALNELQPPVLRLRTGQYLVIPQEHAAALKDQLPKLKVLNGFLVPKEAGEMDVYGAVPTTAPGVTYLSISSKVGKASLANCRG